MIILTISFHSYRRNNPLAANAIEEDNSMGGRKHHRSASEAPPPWLPARIGFLFPSIDSRYVVVTVLLYWVWSQGYLLNARLWKTLSVIGTIMVCLTKWPATQRFGLAVIFWLVVLWFTSEPVLKERHTSLLPDLGHEFFVKRWEDVHIGSFEMGAINVPDLLVLVQLVCTLTFVMTQPARWIILRRLFTLHALLLLFRCITMSATSLPDAHPECSQREQSGPSVLAMLDFVGIMQPSAPCGVVFTDHTIMFVLLSLVFHTYYRRTITRWALNGVKTGAWVYAMLGIASILATRLYYTVYVLLGIYLSITVWGSYHRIANDVLMGRQFSCVWVIDAMLIYPAIRFMESGDAAFSGLTPMHSEEDSPTIQALSDEASKLEDENEKLRKENAQIAKTVQEKLRKKERAHKKESGKK